MESFPVDIDAEQIVRWVMAEQAAAPSTFKTTARRVTEAAERFRLEENIISAMKSARTSAKWLRSRPWRSRLRTPARVGC